MKDTNDSQKETKYFQIAVPLTKEEKQELDRVKTRKGKAIGFFTREAILEKLSREEKKIVEFER